MTKIMLVEDDNNLREIYEARLLAEGYEIISARDGEEALALAVKEKPDLIISDVMMPKISGFDMLDILRSTPETKNTKVIMMTALSQAEDKMRADKLGADRYLVKSQVTLEDVAKVAREVLTGEDSSTSLGEMSTQSGPIATSQPNDTAEPVPVIPNDTEAEAAPSVEPLPTSDEIAPTVAEESAQIDQQIHEFVENAKSSEPAPAETPIAKQPEPVKPDDSGTLPSSESTQNLDVQVAPMAMPENAGAKANKMADVINKAIEANKNSDLTGSDIPSQHKKVIEPINDMSNQQPDLSDLMAKEEAKNPIQPPSVDTVVAPGGSTATASVADDDDKPVENPPVGGVIAPKDNDPSNVAL